MSIVMAMAAVGSLMLFLASVLALARRRLHVVEDPRIEAVWEMLPHADCGACGQPGCRLFAEVLVQRRAQPGACSVSDPEQRRRIADYLGVAVGEVQRRVARLACAGGSHVARHRARYVGQASCAAAQLVGGGGKACFWGCLGLADCARACTFDAIHMDSHGLPQVDAQKCTACGDCVTACPRDLFSLQPERDALWVACANPERGDGLLAVCEVACTACGRCAQDAPDGLVTMAGNLPRVHPDLPQQRRPIERCPTGAIVWLDAVLGPQRGQASPSQLRHGALRDTAT